MISPALYLVLAMLGALAAGQCLLLGRRTAPVSVRPPLIALVLTITAENAYYGLGRLWPDWYDDLAWWAPGVLFFKSAYILALVVLNARLAEGGTDA